MRCDGEKPICGPCNKRIESFGDCEYADAGSTSADRLQEQISVLETRLEALQNPGGRTDDLTLHQPYAGMNVQTGSGPWESPTVNSPEELIQERSLYVFTYTYIPPDPINPRRSVEAFIPHASQLGFFLDARGLLYAPSSPHSDLSRPSDALTAAMVLLGFHLSPSSNNTFLREIYLSRAVNAVSLGLSEHHPSRVLHTLQASVLVAHYFFLQNRALEGLWHLNNAMSLIFSSQMHRIRSSQSYDHSQDSTNANTSILQHPRSSVEEGERINALWTVLGLNCLWCAVEGTSSTFAVYTSGQGRVDAPWPLESYTEATLPHGLRNSHTLQKYLANISDNGHTLLALYAKAAVLFEQTTLFWKRYSRSEHRSPEEVQEFQRLSSLLTQLIAQIPPIESRVSTGIKKRLLIVHTLTRVTMIRLYSTFGTRNPSSRSIFLEMLEGMMHGLDNVDFNSVTFLDPVMAVIWMCPVQVCAEAIKLFRSTSNYNEPEVRKYSGFLRRILHTMNRYSYGNMLMAAKVAEISGMIRSLDV
ncbi:hypothetical protein D9757_008016 [Collybiopsis confluens]|uniref:Transcription factor domain-containing protein n=1 Tax=Collybiopsis confluens TaxID=2823264 RepID=A0A8H5H672_9AGAR|nr:hypothetical protein D9757_008016 [Collybiopsis confluens]